MSSWDKAGPQRTVVDLHSYISYWYAFLAALFLIAIALNWSKGVDIGMVALLVVLAVLAFVHRKTSDAAESRQSWVSLVSVLLALPLLLSFPIGTWLAIRLLINAPKLTSGSTAP